MSIDGTDSSEFEAEMFGWCEIFDAELAAKGTRIHERKLSLAQMIVHHAILEVSNDTKDDYFSKPWFTEIYKSVEKWYRNQYGKAVDRSHKETLTGCILYRGHFFEISVRRTLKKVEVENETSWLIFPIDVHESETIIEWVPTPPNLDAMENFEKDQFLGDVKEIGCSMRRVSNNLMTIERPDDIASSQADTIPIFLAQSASLLIEGANQRSLGLACWAAHQAVEHALKLMIRQKTKDNPKTHILKELRKSATDLGLDIGDGGFVEKFPGKAITAIRAGEISDIGLEGAYQMYRDSLHYTTLLTAALERKWTLTNAAFLLKKPAFIG